MTSIPNMTQALADPEAAVTGRDVTSAWPICPVDNWGAPDYGADMKVMLEIDARGLLCPLPVLRLRKALMPLERGAVVRLLATDGASWIDVPHFCAQSGQELVSAEDNGTVKTYLIRRV